MPPSRNHPRSPDDLYERAVALHGANRFDAAQALYQSVLRAKRTHTGAQFNLGLIRLHQGKADEGVRLLRKALYQRPRDVEMLNKLGLVLLDLGQYSAAAAELRKAIAVDPRSLDAHLNLARSLQALNRHDEALHHLERAVAIAPGAAQAHADLGMALQTLGRIAEAHQALERAIELAPRAPSLYRALFASRRVTAEDRLLTAAIDMAENLATLNEDEQIHLHFALAKAFGDLGRHAASFRHLLAGNALKRRQVVYDEAAVLGHLAQTKALLTADVMREREGVGDPSTAPIFIVGMPRSGSTLIEQILASHPQVYGAGELLDFDAAVASLDRGADTPADIGATELRQIGERYLERVRARVPAGAAYITDKMLGNSRLVGLIHLALPNARIIHARRNPIDNCLSCFSLLFAVGQAFTYDLGELGRFWRAHESLMQHWREVLPAGIMLEVQYEDLVADLETHARRIVAHCRLDWTESCLEFYKTERPVQTASVAQVRQPIYRSSIGRWEPYKAMLNPLLDALETG